MAERRSALAHLSASGSTDAAVTLRELRPASIVQLAAWPDTLGSVEGAVADLLGVRTPRVGHAVSDPDLTIAAIAPGRFLVCGRAPDLAPRFEAALPASDGAVTDLRHGRTILRLEGDAAALLSRCLTLDLDIRAFPPGRVAQTMVHHIDVVVHRQTETAFDLWVLRSFAEALAEWLLDAGLELGVAWKGAEGSARP